MKPTVFAGQVGAYIKGVRGTRQLRQDDVARAARQTGLPWTRSVVVALEAGRRELSIDEFVRLPQVLERLGDATESFEVWLESKGTLAQMRLGPYTSRQDLSEPWADSFATSERLERALDVAFPWTRSRKELAPAYEAAGGDLEQKVGRRYRLDPLVVALVAHATWGHSFTEARDRRVADQASGGLSPRAIQALRGHVTRALLAEIHPQLAIARQRSSRRRRKAARKGGAR